MWGIKMENVDFFANLLIIAKKVICHPFIMWYGSIFIAITSGSKFSSDIPKV